MSQDKTVVPGVNYDIMAKNGASNSFYTRSDNAHSQNKTYVPDLYRSISQELEREETATQTCITLQERALVGVLFSISRHPQGEMLPVYVGRNTIGSNPACDIYLNEESVSDNHAVLLVRQIVNSRGEEMLTATITDYGSENGTMIDGQSLEYERMECHDHSVIQVGNSYQLLFCLFDANAHQLYVDSNFKIANVADKKQGQMNQQEQEQIHTAEEQIPTTFDQMDDDSMFYAPTARAGSDHSTNKTIVM